MLYQRVASVLSDPVNMLNFPGIKNSYTYERQTFYRDNLLTNTIFQGRNWPRIELNANT